MHKNLFKHACMGTAIALLAACGTKTESEPKLLEQTYTSEWANTQTTYEYSPQGLLICAKNADEVRTYDYDTDGRLLHETIIYPGQNDNPDSQIITSYTYSPTGDTLSQIILTTEEELEVSTKTRYTYRPDGTLHYIYTYARYGEDELNPYACSATEYDPQRRILRREGFACTTTPLDIPQSLDTDPAQEYADFVRQNPDLAEPSLEVYTYQFDNQQRVTRRQSTFDGQLSETVTYTYDPQGHPTQELTTYGNDDLGSLKTHYRYDPDGRLLSRTTQGDDWSTATQYTYTPDGDTLLVISRTNNQVINRKVYVYDGRRLTDTYAYDQEDDFGYDIRRAVHTTYLRGRSATSITIYTPTGDEWDDDLHLSDQPSTDPADEFTRFIQQTKMQQTEQTINKYEE